MRILSFADGFTSASAPVIVGGSSLEIYTIANNTTSGSVTFFNPTTYTTIFADFELSREDSGGIYNQQGSIIFAWDGLAWSMQVGSYVGVDMIVETIANPYEIKLMINAFGLITYDSGNMGSSYVGKLKLSLTRIAI